MPFLNKAFFCLCLTMMLSWCCVTKNMEMSLLFLLFVGAISLFWILSPTDVTLLFNGLGIFDYISRACWSKSVCSHCQLMYCIDELLNWQYEHPDQKQATERNLTPRICIYFKTSRGNRLLIHGELCQRTLKQDVLKQRLSSLASKNVCVDCVAIVSIVNS